MGDELKRIDLVRLSSTDRGTPGVFLSNDLPICYSLEEPWLENERYVSCIPDGLYRCTWERHSKFAHAKKVARIHDVPGRSGILIHPGNTLEDIEGCILTGKDFSIKNSAYFLEFSTYSLDKLRIATDEKTFLLDITWSV